MSNISEKKAISVILPVYNAAHYLQRCIDSLLQQTMEDFELICIDDGSTDNSNAIIKRYIQKDSRVQLISQKNCGVSTARNVGIEKAQGKFIAFVDADDWVEPDYLEWLYKTAIQKKVKIVICGHDIIKENVVEKQLGKEIGYLKQNEALKIALRQRGYQGYLWNKIFHNSLFDDEKIRLNPDIFLLEDLLLVCQCMMQVTQVYYEPVVKYHYNQLGKDVSKLTEKAVTMFQAACNLIELFQSPNYVIQQVLAKAWYCQSAGATYLFYAICKDEERATYYKKMQTRYLKEYILCHVREPKMILQGLLIAYWPQLAIWLKKQR